MSGHYTILYKDYPRSLQNVKVHNKNVLKRRQFSKKLDRVFIR